MGQDVSKFKLAIQAHFAPLKGSVNELNFFQLTEIDQPRSFFYVNVRNVGVLYLADADKDGKFSLPDLLNCVDAGDTFHAKFDKFLNIGISFSSFFRAYCSLLLLKELDKPQGQQKFVGWLYQLVAAHCEEEPRLVDNIRYWHGSVARSLFALALGDLNRDPDADYETFQAAMLTGGGDLPPLQLGEGSTNDDLWVPNQVLEDFFQGILEGIAKCVEEMTSVVDLKLLADHVTAMC